MFYVVDDKIVEAGPGQIIPCNNPESVRRIKEVNTPEIRENMRGHRMLGPGGAPNRVSILPDDPAERKKYPIATGVLDYFPDAIAEISRVSYTGNDQHNPGQSLRWDRKKSKDEADTAIRHFMARGTRDTDGQRHLAKAAWRLLAALQKEIEEDVVETGRPVARKYRGTGCDDLV